MFAYLQALLANRLY